MAITPDDGAPRPPIKDRLSARLRELREARGWTVYALSQASGVDQTQLGRIERGERQMTVETAERLADALAVSLDALVGRAQERELREGEKPENLP